MSTVYGPGDPADRAEMRVSDPQRDPAVCELAEEIAGDKYPTAGRGDPRLGVCALHWEGTLTAFLAEREGEREAEVESLRGALDRRVEVVRQALVVSGQVAALRGALEEAREAIASLPEDALGRNQGLSPEMDWPLRDELLDRITRALSPGAGRAEAEVLRSAVHHEEVAEEWLGAMERGPASDLLGSPIYHRLAKAKDALSAAVDALLAARGGEGEG